MKTIAIAVFFLIAYQAQAACRCNCDGMDRTICASAYDLDQPCNGACQMQTGRTACPTTKVYNEFKRAYEWHALCDDA